MSYTSLLQNESLKSQYLAVLKPRRQIKQMTLYGSGVYHSVFDYGIPSKVKSNDTILEEKTAIPATNYSWYYDIETKIVYIKTDGTDPTTTFITVEYEIYVGTIGAHWYRNPLDTSSFPVYYEPLITQSPEVKEDVSETLLGYMPTSSGNITLSNAIHTFERHLFDGIFYHAPIELYHCLDTQGGGTFRFNVDNIDKIIDGIMGDYVYDRNAVSISIVDSIDIYNREFRSEGSAYISGVDFPEVEPSAIGKPIRSVWGVVDGIPPVANIDYVAQGATTSDNRKWLVRADGTNQHNIESTVNAVGTTTRTFLDSVIGFQTSDSVWFDDSTDYFGIVTAVGSNYIDHTAIAAAVSVSSKVKRSTIGNAAIEVSGVTYDLLYNRDYTHAVVSGCLVLELSTSLETNLSLPSPISSSDKITMRVYGKKNDVKMNGNPLGSNDAVLGNLTNSGVILYELLTEYLNIPESNIDQTSINELVADNIKASFCFPLSTGKNFPDFKTIIVLFSQTHLMRLIKTAGKWTFEKIEPFTASDYTVDSSETISFRYEFRHGEIISNAIVEYRPSTNNGNPLTIERSLDYTRYVYGITKQKTFQTLCLDDSEADDIARRLLYIYGYRIGTVSISAKHKLIGLELQDKLSIMRDDMPGFEYIKGTRRERIFRPNEKSRKLTEITINLSDDIGINENSSSW